MRDLAAMQIATLLGTGEQPQPGWSDKRWQEFRRRVLQALPPGSP